MRLMVYPCMFCVALSMDLFVLSVCSVWLTVFVKMFSETIRNMFECVCYFVVGGALLDIPCMLFHRMCVLCLWSK